MIRDLIWSAWRNERNRRVTAESRLEQALTEIECLLDRNGTLLCEKADLINENWHQTIGGMPVAKARVRLLDDAVTVLSAPKGGA